MDGLEAIGDVCTAIVQAVTAMVEAFVHSLIFTAYLVEFLGCLLIWSVACLVGKDRDRPEMRRLAKKDKAKERWNRVGKALLPIALGVLFFGGLYLHDHLFRSRIKFKTTQGLLTGTVEFEWLSKNGKRIKADRSRLFGNSYASYWWKRIRITDPSYENEIVTLTGEDQVIPVTPTPEELARRADQRKETAKLVGKAALALGKDLFEKTVDEVSSASEPDAPPSSSEEKR